MTGLEVMQVVGDVMGAEHVHVQSADCVNLQLQDCYCVAGNILSKVFPVRVGCCRMVMRLRLSFLRDVMIAFRFTELAFVLDCVRLKLNNTFCRGPLL